MAYTHGIAAVIKHCYLVYITTSGGTTSNKFNGTVADIATLDVAGSDFTDHWVKIGALGENPTLKTAEGDVVPLSDCTEKVLSETVEFSCEILEVTKGNWEQVRTDLHNVQCDVLFTESESADADAIGATLVRLSAQLEITSNDKNKILLTGKLEASDIDTKIGFVVLTA